MSLSAPSSLIGASPIGNFRSAQMLSNRRSMQAPTLGELQHSIATLILSYELLDLFRLEPALHLPLPHRLRLLPSSQHRRQLLGKSP
jgi:hypothetical protein